MYQCLFNRRVVQSAGMVLVLFMLMTGLVCAGLRITFNEQEPRIYDAETALRAQQEALDVFHIRVGQVNVVQSDGENDLVVMVKATVEKVLRNSQPRQPGDIIYIRYRTQDGTGYEDDADPKILEEGMDVPAFLRYIGADNHYVLAAGAFSFSLPENVSANREEKPAKTAAVSPMKKAPSKRVAPPVVPPNVLETGNWDEPVKE